MFLKHLLLKDWGSPLINKILNTNAIFKMEFLQNAGTFKARGATNNILKFK